MKKLIMVALISAFGLFATTQTAHANVKKGQKIYKKKFRKSCKFSGVRFARYHTVDEWQEIYEAGKLPEEAKKICPKLKVDKIKKSWWPHLYDFVHEYGEGSPHVPSC